MKNQFENISIAKGIGIILVVYGHVAQGLLKSGIIRNIEVFSHIDSGVYNFHMPLFFFLSGLFFLDSLRNRTIIGFTLRKVETLLYVYILWSLLQGAVEYLFAGFTQNPVTLREIFSLLWHPRMQFWFLYVLFFINIISIPLFFWSNKKTRFIILMGALILNIFKSHIPEVYITGYITKYLFYFSLGVMVKDYLDFFSKKSVLLFSISAPVFVSLHILVFFTTIVPQGIIEYTAPLITLVSIFTVLSASSLISRMKNRKTLILIGDQSLPVYLMHILIGSALRVVLIKIFSVYNAAVHLTAGIVYGIFIPILIAEKIPFLKKLPLFSLSSVIPLSKLYSQRKQTKEIPETKIRAY